MHISLTFSMIYSRALSFCALLSSPSQQKMKLFSTHCSCLALISSMTGDRAFTFCILLASNRMEPFASLDYLNPLSGLFNFLLPSPVIIGKFFIYISDIIVNFTLLAFSFLPQFSTRLKGFSLIVSSLIFWFFFSVFYWVR